MSRKPSPAIVDALWRAANDGLTIGEAAKRIGCAGNWAGKLAQRFGIPLADGRKAVAGALRDRLSEAELADLKLLRGKGGYTLPQALRAIKRADLLPLVEGGE